MSPYLSRITIYPLKSFDGEDVEESVVLRHAGLRHDREYCLLDAEGVPLNAKRVGRALLRIRSEFHFGFGEISLRDGNGEQTFSLERDREKLAEWFTEHLGRKVKVADDPERGFPDDRDASGPTLISTATLEEVGKWFGIDVAEARRRFRANLEIGGVPAFWEDQLYGPPGETVKFRIGEVTIEGVNPCARCAVPSHDSRAGEIPEPRFAKLFAEKREAALPAWAHRGRFDHYYRLSVNTRIPETEAGKELHVSDEVEL